MDWKNAEQFPDYTAGEAIARTLIRNPGKLETLDDEGCRQLAEAVVLQAAEDYIRALRRSARSGREKSPALLELEGFFRSEYFRRLSRLNGDMLIRRIRKAVAEA